MNSTNLTRAADLIACADRLLITAGAGMGVDSGLPDFRGAGGFWRAFPPLAHLGMRFEDMATPSLFDTDPALAWGFYGWRLNSYRAVVPHEGFAMLRRWVARARGDGFVFTSNVDGQFQKAGFEGAQVYECHGSIHHVQCTRPCSAAIWSVDGFSPVVDESTCLLRNEPPRCPSCGALARPNILMFGDGVWIDDRSWLQSQRFADWLALGGRMVIIEIGAGANIPTLRHFADRMTRRNKAHLIRINPDSHKVGREQDVGLAGGALEVLGALDGLLGV